MEVRSFKKEDKGQDQKIIIYGAGRYGELALRGLQQIGLDADYFADRKISRWELLGKRGNQPSEIK